MKDLCLTCGKLVDSKLWGGLCEKDHQVVHQTPCSQCDNLIGYIMDDDYCGFDTIVCTNCLDSIKKKNI